MVEGSCVIRRVELWHNQLSQFAIFDLCMHSLSLNLSPQKFPTVKTCSFIIHNDTYSFTTYYNSIVTQQSIFSSGHLPILCSHAITNAWKLETLNISKQCPMHHHSCFQPSINDRRVLALETKLMEASIVSILPPLIRTPCGKTINSCMLRWWPYHILRANLFDSLLRCQSLSTVHIIMNIRFWKAFISNMQELQGRTNQHQSASIAIRNHQGWYAPHSYQCMEATSSQCYLVQPFLKWPKGANNKNKRKKHLRSSETVSGKRSSPKIIELNDN